MNYLQTLFTNQSGPIILTSYQSGTFNRTLVIVVDIFTMYVVLIPQLKLVNHLFKICFSIHISISLFFVFYVRN